MYKFKSLILQGFAAIFSGIASITIITTFGINVNISHWTRGIIIITFAVCELLMHICKLLFHIYCGDKQQNLNPKEGLIITSTNTKWKAIILGFVDCVFDIITAIAIMNNIEFATYTGGIFLVKLGTFIGLSEEISEFILEFILLWFEMQSFDDNTSQTFNCIVFVGMLEITGSFFEIGISLYLITTISADSIFITIAIICLLLLAICIFLSSCGYAFFSFVRFGDFDYTRARDKQYGRLGAAASGLLFGCALWLFIDACIKSNEWSSIHGLPVIDLAPIIVVIMFFIVLITFQWNMKNMADIAYIGRCTNISAWVRVGLFFCVVVGFSACIGSLVILSTRWIGTERNLYFGIAQFAATILIFVAAIVWRFAKNKAMEVFY